MIGVWPGYDPESAAARRWRTAAGSHTTSADVKPRPDEGARLWDQNRVRLYDTLMLMVLAITAANSTNPALVKAKYREVANPGPGKTEIFPGEFAKARALLMAGRGIYYTGGSGPMDLGPSGDVNTTTFQVFQADGDGVRQTLRFVQSVEPQ